MTKKNKTLKLIQNKRQRQQAMFAKMHGRKLTKFDRKVSALEGKGFPIDSARRIAGSILVKERKRFGTRIVFKNGRKVVEPAFAY